MRNLREITFEEFLNRCSVKNDTNSIDFFRIKNPGTKKLKEIDFVFPHPFPFGKEYWLGVIIMVKEKDFVFSHVAKHKQEKSLFERRNTSGGLVYSAMMQGANDLSEGVGVKLMWSLSKSELLMVVNSDEPQYVHKPF